MVSERRQPLKVEVPGSADDGVKFARVGIIAAVGFAIGIAWPRLAGVRLVPSAPLPAAAEASARELSGAPSEPKPAEEAAPAASQPEAAPAERILVSDVQIASCRDEHGKRVEKCDAVDFDRVAREHLRELSACPKTETASGVLSLGFELDFFKGVVAGIQSGKSTTLPQPDADRFLSCARERFANVALVGIPHQEQRYTVYYRLEVLDAGRANPEASASSATAEITPASGRATVTWDVALVRKNPARDAEVLARVLAGTRLVVTAKSGDWFQVKYDARGNQGWVFRTAIGM